MRTTIIRIFLTTLYAITSVAQAAPVIVGGSEGAQFNAPLIWKSVTEPSSPASGFTKVWISSVDGRMYRKTSAGTVVEVGPDISGKLTDPMTTNGDMIYRAAGVPARLAIGASDTVQVSNGSAPGWAKILNANIDSAAAIAYSKLDLVGSIVDADIDAAAAIDYSKLDLVGDIVNADVNASAGIVYSKLDLTGGIVNADINASAGIVDTKLATISTSGKVSNSATTATSSNTNSAIVARDGSGNFSAGTVSANLTGNVTGNVTGNADTATALAANPTACASDRYATDSAANGDLTCAQVTNAGLAGSIAASKLIGTDITTVGTIGTGTWQGSIIQPTYGGTGQSTLTGLNIPSLATDVITFDGQASAPSSPSAGFFNIWVDDASGKPKIKNSAGTVSSLGGGGSGGKNYMEDLFEGTTVTGLNVYADAAGVAPVDCTGGSITTELTTTINSSTNIITPSNALLTKDGSNRQGYGWSYDFTLDQTDYEKGMPVFIKFDNNQTANFASGDIKLYVYDRDGANLLNVTTVDNQNGSLGKSLTSQGYAGWFTPHTSHNDYRLCIHIAGTTSGTFSVNFARPKITPQSDIVISSGGPIGEIISWPAATMPDGFLAADGSAVSRTTYADLYAVIGITHGQGDGSTTFNLPDYRGRFLRGVDGSAGRDPNDSTRTAMNTGGNTGDNVGSVQTDAFQGHAHLITDSAAGGNIVGRNGGSESTGVTFTNSGGSGSATRLHGSGGTSSYIENDGTNGTPRFSTETRPINAYVNFGIRYKKTGNVLTASELSQQDKYVSNNTSTITPSAQNIYVSPGSGNSLALTPGDWTLWADQIFGAAAAVGYGQFSCAWYSAQGTNSGTPPTALSSASGLTILSGNVGGNILAAPNGDNARHAFAPLRVRLTQDVTVYFVCISPMTTASNARWTTYVYGERKPNFQAIAAAMNGPPTVQRLTSGSSATYTTPRNVRYLKIRLCGGGGGGSGVATSGAGVNAGGTGGTTSFGTSLLSATGGTSSWSVAGAVGGTPTVNSPAVLITSHRGAAGQSMEATASFKAGGTGGSSPFGGNGYGNSPNSAGTAAEANSCSGGGGGSWNGGGGFGAPGGGAGGYLEAYIYNPSSTYTYTIGSGGSAGAAGGGNAMGGSTGGSGLIIVEEFY